MKWFWRVLALCAIVLVLVSSVIIVIRWMAMRSIHVTKTPQANQEWCAVDPVFEMMEDSEMVLATSFWAEAYSFYSVSPDLSFDDGIYVMEGSEILVFSNLEPGWNTIYFSYGRADPQCWSLVTVELWAPYLRFPWETDDANDSQKKPLPIHHGDTLEANLPVRFESG